MKESVKEQKVNIDEIDKKILEILEKNGKALSREIQREITEVKSPQTIANRIKFMKDAGVFGYTILRDPAYLPNNIFGLILITQPQRGEDREVIIDKIKKLAYLDANNEKKNIWDSISAAFDLLGRFDMGFIVNTDSIDNLGRIAASINTVIKTETLIVSKTYKIFLPYRVGVTEK